MQEEIKRIVENCQKCKSNHVKSIKLLRLVFNSNNYDVFLETFLQHVEGTIQSDFKNPYVRNVLEFMAMFVSTLASANAKELNKDDATKDSDTGSETEIHPFLGAVVKRVIQYRSHKDWVCRYNTCMFLSMTLQHTDGELDDNIIELIQEAMLECIQDPKPLVRLEAVRALHRIQDTSNPYCPVIAAISKRLTDSNPKVRKDAVKYIAPTAKTVVYIKDTVFDKDPGVRCNAFTHVANLSMKYFKIAHRQEILWAGFAEVNPVAKKKFKEYLLPKWLTSSGGCYINMLQAIKLYAEEKDIKYTEELSQKIVEAFFETKPITELIRALSLNENKLIPEDDVRSELVLYWNMLVKHLRKSDKMEEYLGEVLPELTPFCHYIDRLIVNKYSKLGDDWEKVNFQYLLYHLFDMAAGYDLSEEMGRRTLDELIKSILSKHRLQSRLLNKLIQIDRLVARNVDTFTTEICSILSEIWQPMTVQPINENEIIQKKYEISNLKMQINIMQENQDLAVQEKRFDVAHELTPEINRLKLKLEELQEDLKSSEHPPATTQNTDDPEILCWCLDLLASLLEHGNIRILSPSLISCLNEFLLPLGQSSIVDVQIKAFKCLADYCVLDRKLAEVHLKTLGLPLIAYRILPNFNKSMVIDSIKSLTDLLRLYGAGFFDNDSEGVLSQSSAGSKRKLYSQTNEEDPNTTNGNPLNTEFIISVCFEMIDDEDDDIRVTALVLIGKLILTGFPVEPIMLTRLVLKWICPTTQKSFQFKLGNLFSKYIAWVPNARQTMAQSIVTILTRIADAPRTSPLADIDVDDVLRFLVCVTDDNNTNLVHTSLAKKLLQEISMKPTDKTTIYFSKMLNLLKLPAGDTPDVQELITQANNIQEMESLEKVPKKQLSKFVMRLLGQKADSTTASVNITLTTANTTQNATIVTQGEDVGMSRRLSSVIEEDSTENEEDGGPVVEKHAEETVPSKKRRIDLSSDLNRTNSEISLNAASSTNIPAVSRKPNENIDTISKDDSDSDIVPDSQDTQSIPKPGAIQIEGKNNNNNNIEKVSQTATRVKRTLRSKTSLSSWSSDNNSIATNSPPTDNENGKRKAPMDRARRLISKKPLKQSDKRPQELKKQRNGSLRWDESSSESLDRTPERRSLRVLLPTSKGNSSEKSSLSGNSTSSQELPERVNGPRRKNAINGKKTAPKLFTQPSKKYPKKLQHDRLRKNSQRSDESSSESVNNSPARKSLRIASTNKTAKRRATTRSKTLSSDGDSDNDISPERKAIKSKQKEPTKKVIPAKKVNGVLALQNSPISKGKRDLLRTTRQNNDLKVPELVVRLTKISIPTKPVQKTAQVKRRKLRKSKSTSDESKENVYVSDTSIEESFHTFLQPDQFQQSLLDESGSETTTVRRSRRLQVVDSETSSDEHLLKSARRSTSSPRKKTV
ncbi:condensin complex subunit 3 isoform X2 [Anthonomus grandis grandis]|uniref:condensin complex subunit 3 isoform X2 n=1 Tax=Anthonomus grandis grandis TaxID=2921223 RepID=UPI002165E727|nr:condensin complex subunit 3 isoform X2 [Anthonomus grandis grandis]